MYKKVTVTIITMKCENARVELNALEISCVNNKVKENTTNINNRYKGGVGGTADHKGNRF